ncbi:adenine deaminase C-terminal domain-containing protein [Oceanobacillus iheyensis]|uniref:adenine deaminase n=1 Tax=Oceanobacillus iheyensis TaxID=182710 RepID=UPI00363D3F0D
MENGRNWRNRELRQHVKVIDGTVSPTLLLKNATYLNVHTKQWLEANIWIYKDRIIYVGEKLPNQSQETEVYDCEGRFVVPGYIEPHAHPFQLANPEITAMHAAKTGTTTLVNDNLTWYLLTNKKKAFSIIDQFNKLPISMFWWSRYDSQTTLQEENHFINTNDVLDWINHPSVVQGGELTDWPSLLAGDDRLLYWIQETKRNGKPIEGHLPGASLRTLTKMKLLGISADHEAMTGKDVMNRLQLGYMVGLRYSPIRPDLPAILEELLESGLTTFDQLTFTMDGPTPYFMKDGVINTCIQIAIDKGIPLEDAYRMGSFHAAKHLRMDEELGSIAPGRIAHINILQEKENPNPIGVLAKGEWIVKETKEIDIPSIIDWSKYEINEMNIDWDLTEDDLQFSVPVGMDVVNDVIIKPYTIDSDVSFEELNEEKGEQFILLIDRKGKWRVNTIIRGFAPKLGALVSSYSASGDIIIIGNSKKDIFIAWNRLKEIKGGIILVNDGEILTEIPLPLGGSLPNEPMEQMIKYDKQLKDTLQKYGFAFYDPVYSLLFLSAFHLPFFRITQKGLLDVKNRDILFPATMR